MSDHNLEAAVMQALAHNPLVHADEIAVQAIDGDVVLRGTVETVVVDVEAREGTVTLRGLVERPSQRDRAERIALGVGGVAHVRNQLAVWITVPADDVPARVTDAVGLNAVVGADRITVTVRDNDVTLTGTVTSRDHRDAGVAAAAGAPGVARVPDRMNVRTDGS